ncbi:Potassium channel SKOR [Diplonema papillatum]|nr:Potassium channel SKOR [Diplonema papillatum]
MPLSVDVGASDWSGSAKDGDEPAPSPKSSLAPKGLLRTPASPLSPEQSMRKDSLRKAVIEDDDSTHNMSLTNAALSRIPRRRRTAPRRSTAVSAISMLSVLKKIKSERAKAREDRDRGGQFSVLQKTKDSLAHLEGAMKSDCLQPDAAWRQYWDLMITVLILYYWIFVPMLYVAHRENFMFTSIGHALIEVLATVVFIVDMLLCFDTAIIDKGSGIVHYDRQKIRQAYIYGGFTWDLLAALPLDLFILWAFGSDMFGGWVYTLVSHLRLLKVFRVYSLFKIVNSLRLDSQLVSFHYGIVPNVQMAFACVVGLHIMTIMFMLLNTGDTYDDEDFTYTTSLYWTLYTVTSVGYGDIPVDTPWKRRYAALLFVIGVILHGIVISEISYRMQRGDVQSERRDKMKETLNIMQVFSIPEELQREVFAFQYHQLHSSVGGQFMKVLETLPSSMRNRVDLYVRVKFICKVPMFARQDIDCLVDLANGLRNLIYEPEQVIIRAGDEGAEMYFLAHGFGDVLSPLGVHWGVIRPGGFFGEMALLSESKRNATIRALTYCDLFQLQKDKFIQIMDKYPELEFAVQKEVERRKKEQRAGQIAEETKEEEKKKQEKRHSQDQQNATPGTNTGANEPAANVNETARQMISINDGSSFRSSPVSEPRGPDPDVLLADPRFQPGPLRPPNSQQDALRVAMIEATTGDSRHAFSNPLSAPFHEYHPANLHAPMSADSNDKLTVIEDQLMLLSDTVSEMHIMLSTLIEYAAQSALIAQDSRTPLSPPEPVPPTLPPDAPALPTSVNTHKSESKRRENKKNNGGLSESRKKLEKVQHQLQQSQHLSSQAEGPQERPDADDAGVHRSPIGSPILLNPLHSDQRGPSTIDDSETGTVENARSPAVCMLQGSETLDEDPMA